MIELRLQLGDEQLSVIADLVVERLAVRQPAASDDGFLDVAGAAAFLSCPTSRIYALVSAKRIPHYKDGSRLLFLKAELREFVSNGGGRRQ